MRILALLKAYLTLGVIVGALPNNIANGQTEDAVPVMANYNWLVNQVNANAAQLSLTPQLASANTFTQVQSGIAAAAGANFPTAAQVQNGAMVWNAAGGTADAITITCTPPLTSLGEGMLLGFRATAANATTTPTFSPDALTAHTITKRGGAALAAGDIPAANAECLLRYNLASTRWELIIAGTPTFANQSANTILAGPASGAAAAPTFRTPVGADGASWVLLAGATSGSVATVDLALTAGYSTYFLDIISITPATDNSDLWLRYSEDSGATFKAGATDYAHTRFNNVDGGAVNVGGSAGDTKIILGVGLGNGATKSFNGLLKIAEPANTVRHKMCDFSCAYQSSANTIVKQVVGGNFILDTNAITNIRLMMSAGNINVIYALYGVRNT